ncbi:MAG: DUF4876 domain-containing protein [Melioribacteraceae bacterium]|nr:DUF4876 domain-containing protein [Melioribacteraceae bacterium]
MKKRILFISLLAVLFSCQEKAPVQVDGKAELKIAAMWEVVNSDSSKSYIPLANAEMILVSEYGMRTEHTDETGAMHLTDIPSSIYQISARKKHPDDSNIFIVGNITNIEVVSGTPVNDTIFAKPISSSGISINEIYAGGPVNNIFFFRDQFIELYNSSNDVKFLDGMQVFRLSFTDEGTQPPGGDWGFDNDIDGVTYAFKFPGRSGEQNFPFEPHSFIVLARDAYNHQNSISTSINLSNADWEFVNQLSAIEFDNPSVPNLRNIRLDKNIDFIIRLDSDRVIITSGVDTVWEDGIDIETILDGVEYRTGGIGYPTLDDRIDRGWIKSPPKYNGESMQRREKGIDTNDGTLDWKTIPYPTPGWQ